MQRAAFGEGVWGGCRIIVTQVKLTHRAIFTLNQGRSGPPAPELHRAVSGMRRADGGRRIHSRRTDMKPLTKAELSVTQNNLNGV